MSTSCAGKVKVQQRGSYYVQKLTEACRRRKWKYFTANFSAPWERRDYCSIKNTAWSFLQHVEIVKNKKMLSSYSNDIRAVRHKAYEPKLFILYQHCCLESELLRFIQASSKATLWVSLQQEKFFCHFTVTCTRMLHLHKLYIEIGAIFLNSDCKLSKKMGILMI